ncbi:MAG: hypothetical protein JWR59_857, partial [Brevundimonas sp.]|nr:hypothetical protein [Brevundimonas sp.]
GEVARRFFSAVTEGLWSHAPSMY